MSPADLWIESAFGTERSAPVLFVHVTPKGTAMIYGMKSCRTRTAPQYSANTLDSVNRNTWRVHDRANTMRKLNVQTPCLACI